MKVVLVKKAVKAEPYVWLRRADGKEELKCGTKNSITKLQKTFELTRINRGYAVCPSIIKKIKGFECILTTGETLKISRRRLKSIEYAAAAH